MMARDRSRAGLEEARSDGGDSEGSLEEISSEDFKHDARSRAWMGYSMPRNYASNLYNLAWAQAVQNKPLAELMPTRSGDLAAAKDQASSLVVEDSGEGSGDNGEKEEGELEEGEIGFGLEVTTDNEEALNGVTLDEQENQSGKKDSDVKEAREEIDDFDKRVSLILEELESVTEEEAASSFETVCLRLRKSFENLKPMFSGVESSDTVLDALVQQAFLGIQTVHSQVLNSNDMRTKEQNKELLLRLLVRIKNQYSKLLTCEQISEIDAWLNSLVFEDRNKEKNVPGSGHIVNSNATPSKDQCVSDLDKQSFISSFSNSNAGKGVLSKLEVSSLARGRGPLLDLHADYDENSLPSPTRDNPPQFPMPKPIGYGVGSITYSQPIIPKRIEEKEPMLHSYAKDAVKAVSSYQQKWTSVPTINRLPSPTPSEEGNIGGDTQGEISSSSTPKDTNLANVFQVSKPSCSGLYTNGATADQLGPNKLTMKGAPVANHVVKSTAKSRDPRLRFMNPGATGSLEQIRRMGLDPSNINNRFVEGIQNNKKHKPLDDSLPEDYSSKRPRNDVVRTKDMSASGRGGWLEDGNFVAAHPSNRIRTNDNSDVTNRKSGHGEDGFDRRPAATTDVPNSIVKQNPSFNPSAPFLPSLLKAVNPTILKQLLEIKNQRLSSENQQKNSGVVSSTSTSLTTWNEVGQNPPGKPQMLMSSIPVNPQIRMKPRDPRRILHSNMVQKSENPSTGQTRNGVSSSMQSSTDNVTARETREQAEKSNLYPQAITAKPDISQQVATNPKQIASILSNSQKTNPPTTLPVSNKKDQLDVKVSAADSNDPKNVSSVVSEDGSAHTSQLKNPWGDVELEHLLDGYDDEQKAAIQKERARRIAEQNKMFAARKLCLVLDLDHTLLNSAKFVEIDPAHEEILRKKEEQDRERPQRHLYRFLHMGMWTKLRPGIWNFLERASKLFELHLYTMGNKLYATEMARILDPTGMLFNGRVLSRGDDGDPFDGDERVPKSKDLDGVLGMESAVVIIDDSVRVWPHNRLNLIVVERYTYFPCSRRQFGLPGPSLLEIDHDERPEDGTLASSLAVIERIHQIFFSHDSLNDVDVRSILAEEQRKILAGCRILFSRIFPVGEANPHLHPLWQTAEQFGAVCTNQIDDQVTHVVANCLGTDKVNWALSSGRFVVQPGWVEASALLYRRANEHDFVVKIQ